MRFNYEAVTMSSYYELYLYYYKPYCQAEFYRPIGHKVMHNLNFFNF